MPKPVWISGQSKPREPWTFYHSTKKIPLPTKDGVKVFPPWFCTRKPTGQKPVSVASWGYGWRIYEGAPAQKYFMCSYRPKFTTVPSSTLSSSTVGSTTTPHISRTPEKPIPSSKPTKTKPTSRPTGTKTIPTSRPTGTTPSTSRGTQTSSLFTTYFTRFSVQNHRLSRHIFNNYSCHRENTYHSNAQYHHCCCQGK